MSIATLIDDGFQRIGAWRTAECRPHKLATIRYQSGLYVFVVGEMVMYVGKAAPLHRRLRNYTNRSFRNGNRLPRRVHVGINSSVAGGVEVLVFVKVIDGSTKSSLLPIEAALIRKLDPPWNA